jgi:hypothetical protein
MLAEVRARLLGRRGGQLDRCAGHLRGGGRHLAAGPADVAGEGRESRHHRVEGGGGLAQLDRPVRPERDREVAAGHRDRGGTEVVDRANRSHGEEQADDGGAEDPQPDDEHGQRHGVMGRAERL